MGSLPKIAVVLLLYSCCAASIRFNRQGKVDVFYDDNSQLACFLPCSVQSSTNKSLPNRPYVVWKRQVSIPDPEYVRLNDAQYWRDNSQIFFSNVPTRCTERQNSSGVYDCDIIISRCVSGYYGAYQCNVYDFDNGVQLSRIVQVDLGGARDSFVECVTPDVILNAALLDGNTTTSPSVNFSWTLVPTDDENATICTLDYSVRHFTSTVPYDFEDETEPATRRIDDIKYINLEQGGTSHIFSEISTRHYYQFHLRVTASPTTSSVQTFHHYSYIYFFGQQVPARVVNPIVEFTTIRGTVGDEVNIPCEGVGTPNPSVLLLREVSTVPPLACGNCPLNKGTLIPDLSLHDAGEYFCVSANILVNPPEGKRTRKDWKTIKLIVDQVMETPLNTSHCASYTHSTCSAFIDQSVMVYIDGAAVDGDVELLQHRVVNLIREIEINTNHTSSRLNPEIRDKCSLLAQSIACHSVFPYCHSQLEIPKPRPICKSTCDIFSPGGLCEVYLNAWTSRELYTSLMANCDTRSFPAGSDPECIPISIDTARSGHYDSIDHSWCSLGDGRSYVGNQQRTASGRYCQSWSSQDPHKHPFDPSRYPTELLTSSLSCRNPGGVGEGPWCYTSDPNVRWEYCDVPQCEVCEQYGGGFCSAVHGYDDSNMTVYVNRSHTHWGASGQSAIERFLSGIFEDLSSVAETQTWTPGCEFAVRQLLCHTTLPFCQDQGKATPRTICNDQCKLLDTIQFCSTVVYGKLLQVMMHDESNFFSLPGNCKTTVDNGPSSESDCMAPPSGLILTPLASTADNTDTDCYNAQDYGQSYTGQLSTTGVGVACQAWDHTHLLFHADLYPDLEGAGYFCRNPGQLKQGVWCFTSRASWDYCIVPRNCSDTVTPTSSASESVLVISLGSLFAFLVLVVLIIVVCIIFYCRVNRDKLLRPGRRSPPLVLKSVPSDIKMIENGNYITQTPMTPRMMETINKFRLLDGQLYKQNIRYIKQIGQGNFGVVFLGRMSDGLSNNDEEMEVAVKTLKDDYQDALEDFAREAKIMLALDHPNIVKLYGVCTDSSPYYLVFEYMDLGDLAKYLRVNASSRQRRLMDPCSHRHSRTESTLSDDPPSLSVKELSDICKQIAAGMEYLAVRSHVHRDLACRNCLVKSCSKADETCSRVIVKIGDFGMSHDLYQRNYYRVQGQAVLPIRWMSPEAVIYGKFSTAGDVYSYGVTMWEIFSFAMQPYFGCSNEEVTQHIRKGRHLEKPSNCPEKIYEIMKMCWIQDCDQRPNFTELQNMINEFRFSLSSESSASSSSMGNVFEEDEDNVFEETSASQREHIPLPLHCVNDNNLQGLTPRHNVVAFPPAPLNYSSGSASSNSSSSGSDSSAYSYEESHL